jgi:hypothetical protein
MDEDTFFKMVEEECSAAVNSPLTNAPVEPSTNGSSRELREYLRQMDDPGFLKEEVNSLITDLAAVLPIALSK